MSRVVVTGGTGFIGRRLIELLRERGDDVVLVSRSPESARGFPGVRAVTWAELSQALSGAAAIVHLAGARAVGVRYTHRTKTEILNSRVISTTDVVKAIAEAKPRPATLVCASGAGYYGGRMDDVLCDETSAPGHDFLAKVCEAWEAAATAAEPLGVRVVRARFGIVIGPGGGALASMALPFQMFAGGPIGSGVQHVPWVQLDDVARMILFCIDRSDLSGPVNCVAPRTVTNAELARAIGRTLGRPAFLPTPAFALKALFGEGAEPLLTGQNVAPRVLERAGFEWRHPELEPALRLSLNAN